MPSRAVRGEDLGPTFDRIGDREDALYVIEEALVHSNLPAINALALAAHLPAIFGLAGARAGALLSYRPSFPDLLRRAADMTAKILRGTKPSDIPVEQPTKFKLVNLKTAKALGLEIPMHIQQLADEVIE
jgi:putative tryptophan/tyrosine transport system substrate-binding protein